MASPLELFVPTAASGDDEMGFFVPHAIDCVNLIALAATDAGSDNPVEIRRRNLYRDDAYPVTSPAKMRFEGLSHHASLNKLVEMIKVAGADLAD